MPWANGLSHLLSDNSSGRTSTHCLYDALPTLLRLTVYFFRALCLLFVLFLLVKFLCVMQSKRCFV